MEQDLGSVPTRGAVQNLGIQTMEDKLPAESSAEQPLLGSDPMAHRHLRGQLTVGEGGVKAIEVPSCKGPPDTSDEASGKGVELGVC